MLYAKQFELTSTESAYTAARFGHKYDAPFLLDNADAYLSANVLTADQPQVCYNGPVPAHDMHTCIWFLICIGRNAPVGHTACAWCGSQRRIRL